MVESLSRYGQKSIVSHYAPYPFALMEKSPGGLSSAFLHEVRNSKSVVFLTTDEVDGLWGGAQIITADVSNTNIWESDLPLYWFGLGCWQWLHPNAHTDTAGDPEAVRMMIEMDSKYAPGSLERLLQYCEAYAPSSALSERFNERFGRPLDQVVPGSIMNWQDYFFIPSMLKHADRLRSLRIFQTFHLHTTVSDSLGRSAFGRDLLKAMSVVDVVYLHTDEYIRRAEQQLVSLGYNVPVLKRFDLGINHEGLEEELLLANRNNYATRVLSCARYSQEQRDLINEIYRTQGTVPHRFIDIDRIDPAKGTATVVRAIEKFLEERSAVGESLEEMKEKYRFFFIQDYLRKPAHPQNLQTGIYGRFLRGLFEQVMARYSGIVFISDALEGEGRLLIPSLLLGAHGITGGAQDGLNLAIMENLYVNRGEDTTIICGDGNGFAIHTKTLNLAPYAFFPRAGDVEAFTQAIHEAVILQSHGDGTLLRKKAPLVDHVLGRRDSIIVDC
ncbi:MAG: hypothetical protein KME30_28740 [Iphinoe sp. HA4291-MV1]|nr:hypothetical protein [Iphinoe sp. HA4291-MV1]